MEIITKNFKKDNMLKGGIAKQSRLLFQTKTFLVTYRPINMR